MVSVVDFSARPRDDDNRPIPGRTRNFHLGERVRLLGCFFDDQPADNPNGWMAVFSALDPSDANRYAAVESYFLPLEWWEGIRRHLAEVMVRGDVEYARIVATNPVSMESTSIVKPSL
jgi:hypothetical protein